MDRNINVTQQELGRVESKLNKQNTSAVAIESASG
jgi:hypothetical protein